MSSHLDDVFRALAGSDRRRVLIHLSEQDTPGALEVPGDVPIDNRELRLHHVDLPQLEDSGLIRWDRNADTIRKGPRFDEVEPILNVLTEDPDDCVVPE